jgi:hypothetical protein
MRVALKSPNSLLTIIINKPFVFDDVQRFIEDFDRINLDAPGGCKQELSTIIHAKSFMHSGRTGE